MDWRLWYESIGMLPRGIRNIFLIFKFSFGREGGGQIWKDWQMSEIEVHDSVFKNV